MAQPHQLQRLLAGGCDFGRNAHLFQHQPRVLTVHGIVVDDEHVHTLRVILLPVGALAVHQRQRHEEGRADAFLALDLNAAVHHLHDALGDCHAETRAAVLAGGRGILLTERLKEFGQKRLVHTDAGV